MGLGESFINIMEGKQSMRIIDFVRHYQEEKEATQQKEEQEREPALQGEVHLTQRRESVSAGQSTELALMISEPSPPAPIDLVEIVKKHGFSHAAIYESLGLDQAVYEPLFRLLERYWMSGDHLRYRPDVTLKFFYSSLPYMEKIAKSSEEWDRLERHLANAAESVFGNGIDQFFHAVQQLVEREVVRQPDEFKEGVNLLVAQRSKRDINGAHFYGYIGSVIADKKITSLSQLRDLLGRLRTHNEVMKEELFEKYLGKGY